MRKSLFGGLLLGLYLCGLSQASPPGYDQRLPAPTNSPTASPTPSTTRITKIDVVPQGVTGGIVALHAGQPCRLLVNVKRSANDVFGVKLEIDGKPLPMQDSNSASFAWDQGVFSWDWTATTGEHTVKAKLDFFGAQSAESSYLFQVAGVSGESTARSVDLQIGKIRMDSEAGSSELNIEVTVVNGGDEVAAAPFEVLVMAGGLRKIFTQNTSLAPRQSTTFRWTIPSSAWNSKPQGRVVADPEGKIKESDRTNNVKEF